MHTYITNNALTGFEERGSFSAMLHTGKHTTCMYIYHT